MYFEKPFSIFRFRNIGISLVLSFLSSISILSSLTEKPIHLEVGKAS